MASIKFNIKTKKNPSNLNIRFYHTKSIDCNAPSNILIDPKLWSNKMQNLKPAVNREIKKTYQDQIDHLRREIILRFNVDYSSGVDINSKWLKSVVADIQNRPKEAELHETYFKEFVLKYIEDAKTRINPRSGKKLSRATFNLYDNVLNKVLKYEELNKVRLRLVDINLDFHKGYTHLLKVELNYGNNFIYKNLSQIKSWIKAAEEKGYKISQEAKSRKFSFPKEETIDTYLNEQEIDAVFNHDFSDNKKLDNVRDLFIIGLWTGLRISDLKRISEFHFTNNTIIISGTEKTDDTIEIPIHPQVKAILEKRNNVLPNMISNQNFNEYIKDVCEEVGFKEKILGKLMNPETNRKERGYYEKYKLIASHTCRRSFATNHYGKLPDKTIMAITTHKSHSQFLEYIKTTQKEHIEKFAELWNGNGKV